jgi:hypothetical protein
VEEADAVEHGHHHVGEDEVGRALAGRLEAGEAVGHGGHDVVLGEQAR